MQAKLEDFNTGWFGLHLGLTDNDISVLINRLSALRESKGHFHARRNFGDVDSYGALCLTQVLHFFRIPICHVKLG
jgi:hypothetical protein